MGGVISGNYPNLYDQDTGEQIGYVGADWKERFVAPGGGGSGSGESIIASQQTIGPAAAPGHLLLTSTQSDTAARIHLEPNGYPTGTTSKIDLMVDPYDDDPANYRIGNMYAKSYDAADASTTQGNGGVVVIGAKSVGSHWGIWPTIHFGFSDDGAGAATPVKLYYFDTTDTAWRTPMRGGWRAGLSISIGDYCTANNKIYQATTAGTTGATMPSHTSGNASDGAVSWDWIRTPNGSNVAGCMVVGDRDDMPKFGFSAARMQFSKETVTWYNTKHRYLDSSNAASWYTHCFNTSDFRIEYDASHYIRYSKSSNFYTAVGLARTLGTVTDTSATVTPGIAGAENVVLTPASAITVTSFTGGLAHQIFCVEAGNANVTLQHGASIKLAGAVNKTLSTDDVLMFKMNSGGTIAKQII